MRLLQAAIAKAKEMNVPQCISVVAVSLKKKTIYPLLGIAKKLSVQFVLGYTPDEFAATLGHIAEGAIPVAPLLTGRVGLDGVARAFEDLSAPDRHAKILVEPGRA
jgi:threonine dehydrogenase-like Zn-dependent dehydrogenase